MPWRSVSGREGKGFLPGSWATLSREGKMPSHFSPCQAVISFCVGLAHTRQWTSPGQGWMPHREIKERLSLGLPWWSSGWDSGLPMQGPRFQLWLGELRSHMACNVAKKTKTNKPKKERDWIRGLRRLHSLFACLYHFLSLAKSNL